MECFEPHASVCRIEPVCTLRDADARLQAFDAVVDEYTLADVLHNRDQLAQKPIHSSAKRQATPSAWARKKAC